MTAPADPNPYNELAFYTLAHPDPAFFHQNIVDANIAQNADESTKPIALAFALIGLYLSIERNYTGRQVQLAHMQLAKLRPGGIRKQWPVFALPKERGAITASDVLAKPAGPDRDEKIHQWCISVWEAWKDSHQQVRDLIRNELGV